MSTAALAQSDTLPNPAVIDSVKIAARQVEADGVTENQASCGVDRNICPAGAEGDGEDG